LLTQDLLTKRFELLELIFLAIETALIEDTATPLSGGGPFNTSGQLLFGPLDGTHFVTPGRPTTLAP